MTKKTQPHSAEYFGATRDFWWNPDFLELMARRWKLSRVREVLDAGCGVGHWGRALAPFLRRDARVHGIDREASWVKKAASNSAGTDRRFVFRRADATALPFPPARFDLVTCQTLLIHLPDPRAALAEFFRVLKPGGLLILSEPNNLAGALVFDDASAKCGLDDKLAAVRLQALCERGKAALGLGDNSVGERLPALLQDLGATEIRAHLSDKAAVILPGVPAPAKSAAFAQQADWIARGFWIWDKAETRRYFAAGGGRRAEFAALWSAAMRLRRASATAARADRLSALEGSLQYLISARKAAR